MVSSIRNGFTVRVKRVIRYTEMSDKVARQVRTGYDQAVGLIKG